MGLDDCHDGIEACEGKSNEEINAYRAEKRLSGGLVARKNATKDNHNNEDVKCKAENDVEDRRRDQLGAKNDRVFQECGTGKNKSDKEETSPEAHRVYAHQCDGGACHPEHVK